MGHMLEKQGVQNVLAALPAIAEAVPGFRFLVIGAGAYLDPLRNLARELKVEHLVRFTGYVEDIRQVEDMLARSGLAIAPYLREKDTWTRWADPGKVKSYLACGLPVLLTDLPWNAQEIEAARCGRIIASEPEAIARAVIEYMGDDALLREQRANAVEYAKRFDYKKIFQGLQL
jgi:glycosyltransferase involved in cell wall biosynthesis